MVKRYLSDRHFVGPIKAYPKRTKTLQRTNYNAGRSRAHGAGPQHAGHGRVAHVEAEPGPAMPGGEAAHPPPRATIASDSWWHCRRDRVRPPPGRRGGGRSRGWRTTPRNLASRPHRCGSCWGRRPAGQAQRRERRRLRDRGRDRLQCRPQRRGGRSSRGSQRSRLPSSGTAARSTL